MEDYEECLQAGRLKEDDGKCEEAFSLYQHGLEKIMDKMKRKSTFILLFIEIV